MIWLLATPVLLGIAALVILGATTYTFSGGQYLFPANAHSLFSMVMWGVGGLFGIRLLYAFLDRDNEDLGPIKTMSPKAEVIPVYEYQDVYYEAPAVSVDTFKTINVKNSHHANVLVGMPSSVPLHQAPPLNPTPNTTVNEYGQPEYMVDGTLIGYRYFDRDVEGNLHSVVTPDMMGGNWGAGENSATHVPTKHNSTGLYGAYTPDSRFLKPYHDRPVKAIVGFSGQVVYGEKGFRAQHGKVIQILEEKTPPGYEPLKFHKDRMKGKEDG